MVWLGSPDTGPPTSLQYRSWTLLPVSSSPQVAVAVILVPSARLKYGGCRLYPFTPLVGSSCADARVTNSGHSSSESRGVWVSLAGESGAGPLAIISTCSLELVRGKKKFEE